jgi:2,3-bisphosphoglycerate-independent phosphoglycerate mutase
VPVLDAIGPAVTAAVLPDHPVPIATGKHTRTPVPVSVRARDRQPDAVRTFDEVACRAGALGAMKNGDLMAALFPRPAL